jgi:hypothetical protein
MGGGGGQDIGPSMLKPVVPNHPDPSKALYNFVISPIFAFADSTCSCTVMKHKFQRRFESADTFSEITY